MDTVLSYQRWWPLDGIEISRSHVDGRTVEAYAAVFDRAYEVRDVHGHYNEVIERSAFNGALAAPDVLDRVMCLFNHGLSVHGAPSDEWSVPIGKPLKIQPDRRGLLTVTRYNRGEPVDRVLEAIRNGAIKSQSFRGRIIRSSPGRVPRTSGGQLPTITRHELGLSDYGPTPVPVAMGAEILAVRGMAELMRSFTGAPSPFPRRHLDAPRTSAHADALRALRRLELRGDGFW